MRPLARNFVPIVAATLAAATGGSTAAAQSLAERISAIGNGTALIAFPARDDVCGNGAGMVRFGDGHVRAERGSDWGEPCVPGPVRVVLRFRKGRVVDLATVVGGRSWADVRGVGDLSGAVDLGMVDPAAAAGWLIGLARRHDGEAGEDALFPAILARGVQPWRELLALARDGRVRTDTREQATFWLGQAAGREVAGDLEALAGDDQARVEVREAAVFALSRMDDEEAAVEALLRVYRRSDDPRIKKRALFWLAESDDPRALDLFESILLGR